MSFAQGASKAQQQKPEQRAAPIALGKQLAELDAAFEKAYAAKEFAAAERAMREIARLQPGNIAARYNLALVIAMQSTREANRDAEAAGLIVSAIDGGFSDVRRILRDPVLRTVREEPALKALLEDWAKVQERQRSTLLAKAMEQFESCTHRITLDDLRIELVTNLPQDEAGLIAGELAKVHDFLVREVLPSDKDLGLEGVMQRAIAADAKAAAHFAEPWSIIIIPSAAEYKRWTQEMFGGSANAGAGAAGAVGGLYDHASKRLVAIDAGSTLRHEFAHVLHQRLCERTGQTHPVWLLEAIATLVEDMDPNVTDDFVPATSWRSNTAFRMAGSSVLPTLKSMTQMPPQTFSGPRALAHYAAVRNVSLWAWKAGILRDWLRLFMTSREHGIAADATGYASLLQVASAHAFEKPIGDERDLEKALRSFARSNKTVPESTIPGSASLGITVESRQGVGLVVVDVPLRWATTLRENDVIIKVGAHSVRDIAELLRVMPIASAGLLDLPDPRVSVIVRRGNVLVTVEAPLRRAG